MRFLVCSDVVERGLDVPCVLFVMNVTLPDDKSMYDHRIGRIGRAERMGSSISLVSTHEERMWFINVDQEEYEGYIKRGMGDLKHRTLGPLENPFHGQSHGTSQKSLEFQNTLKPLVPHSTGSFGANGHNPLWPHLMLLPICSFSGSAHSFDFLSDGRKPDPTDLPKPLATTEITESLELYIPGTSVFQGASQRHEPWMSQAICHWSSRHNFQFYICI